MCKEVDGLVGGKYLEQYIPDLDIYSDPEGVEKDIISLDKNVTVSSWIAGILFCSLFLAFPEDGYSTVNFELAFYLLAAMIVVLMFRSSVMNDRTKVYYKHILKSS